MIIENVHRDKNIVFLSDNQDDKVVYRTSIEAEDAIDEMIDWYNDLYGTNFEQSSCEEDKSFVKVKEGSEVLCYR